MPNSCTIARCQFNYRWRSVARKCGRTDLVIDKCQRRVRCCQSQNSFDHVCAVFSADPRNSNYLVSRQINLLLASEFACAIHRLRVRQITLYIRCRLRAVENIISGYIYDTRTILAGHRNDIRRTIAIHRHCLLRV